MRELRTTGQQTPRTA